MSLSSFSLASYIIVLSLALYLILRNSNLRTAYFVLHSQRKDAFDEQESLAWLVGTMVLALSGAIRFLLQELDWMTSTLNAVTLGAMEFGLLFWGWVFVRLVRHWLNRHRVPKSNTKTGKSGVP